MEYQRIEVYLQFICIWQQYAIVSVGKAEKFGEGFMIRAFGVEKII